MELKMTDEQIKKYTELLKTPIGELSGSDKIEIVREYSKMLEGLTPKERAAIFIKVAAEITKPVVR